MLEAECKLIGHCPAGKAVITSGYQSLARFIVHAVTPKGGGDAELAALGCLGCGVYNFPFIPATHIALGTIRNWLERPQNAAAIDTIVLTIP